MSTLDEVRNAVILLSIERDNIPDDKAFGLWILEEFEDFSEENAEQSFTDGANDGGCDAYTYAEEESTLHIYQFKYSESEEYVFKGFKDLQQAIQKSSLQPLISSCDQLVLHLASLRQTDDVMIEKKKKTLRTIRSWLTRNNFKAECEIELIGLSEYARYFNKIIGVPVTLCFKNKPLPVDNAFVGLIDATNFKGQIGKDELFAFNIRRFLGIRKGSINYQIKESLEDSAERERFWILNNGIVCICTDSNVINSSIVESSSLKMSFKNFSILNGAQTVNTICRYANENPAHTAPIWILAKIVQVQESSDPIEVIKITRTSNTQNPTSSKDLRGVDTCHRRLEEWIEPFGFSYIHRRGVRANKGSSKVEMKDMAQAYVAFEMAKPNISFSRPGTIFSEMTILYNQVFPASDIETMQNTGTPDEINQFTLKRLVPTLLLYEIREGLLSLVEKDEIEKGWKSAAYHILWLYGRIFADINEQINLSKILEKRREIISATLPNMINAIIDYSQANEGTIKIPRDLKNDLLISKLGTPSFIKENSRMRKVSRNIQKQLMGESDFF